MIKKNYIKHHKEIEKKIKAINRLSGMFVINNKNYIKTIGDYKYILKRF